MLAACELKYLQPEEKAGRLFTFEPHCTYLYSTQATESLNEEESTILSCLYKFKNGEYMSRCFIFSITTQIQGTEDNIPI